MASGRVKWFSDKKGFGFIENTEGKDVFVHHSDIGGDGFKTLSEGQEVTYDEVSSDKGLKATNVAKN